MKKPEKLPRGLHWRNDSLYIYLTIDGQEVNRSVGRMSVKMAVQQREIWQREIIEGKYLKPKPRTDLVTFADICTQAIDHYKSHTRGWDGIEGRVAVFKKWWDTRTAESITTGEINKQLLANVKPRGLKWTECTSNEYRISLLRIYALALDAGLVSVNPVSKAKRYKLENARDRELTFQEEDNLRVAIRKLYPAKEPELDLALYLGCRRSNLYGIHNKKRKPMAPLQWADVNLDFCVVTFLRSKSGKRYKVPIGDTALAAFKELRERCEDPDNPTGPVIRKPSGIILQSSRRWFENCLKEAKIMNFHWHDFRHTFGSRLREANVQHEDINYLLGHGTKNITLRYAHPPMKLLAAAVAILDRKSQTGTETGTGPVLQFRTAG
jgi:integrase